MSQEHEHTIDRTSVESIQKTAFMTTSLRSTHLQSTLDLQVESQGIGFKVIRNMTEAIDVDKSLQ